MIEQVKSGTRVRFLTLLASFGPGSGSHRPPVSVSGLVVTPSGFTVTVGIDGVRETVHATAHRLSITDAPGSVPVLSGTGSEPLGSSLGGEP